MSKTYRHLSLDERVSLQAGLAMGRSLRSLGVELGRCASTLSRERQRNGLLDVGQRDELGREQSTFPCTGAAASERAPKGTSAEGSVWESGVVAGAQPRYGALSAHEMARQRHRGRTPKLKPGEPLWIAMKERLDAGWSPQQIAGRLRKAHGDDHAQRVSHETIYCTIYALPRGELRREMIAALRQQRSKRRPRGRGNGRRGSVLKDITPIAERPAEVGLREAPGHWEGDLIKGAGNRSAVATLVERTSRLVLLGKMADATAVSARSALNAMLGQLPAALRSTLTWDRGSEMALHQAIATDLKIDVYFADPYAPWQRGSNENANGLIREYLPKGTDLSQHSQAYLNSVAMALNTRPRKVLEFKTPLEVFFANLPKKDVKDWVLQLKVETAL